MPDQDTDAAAVEPSETIWDKFVDKLARLATSEKAKPIVADLWELLSNHIAGSHPTQENHDAMSEVTGIRPDA